MEREAVPLLLPPSTIAWFHYKSTLTTDLNRMEQQIVHHTPSHEVHICTLFDVKSICIFLLSSYFKLFVNINTDIQQEQTFRVYVIILTFNFKNIVSNINILFTL